MLTLSQTRRAIEQAVNEYGRDYVDPNARVDGSGRCKYIYPDGKRCIAGRALEIMGQDMATIDADNDNMSVTAVAREQRIDIDVRALAMLQEAQKMQDYGYSWGKIEDTLQDWTPVV